MKDSGVEWIGEIPKEWTLSKMKSFLRNVSVKDHPDEQVLSLYRDYGVIPKDSRDDNHNVTSEDTASYKYVEVGDLVINKMKAWQGSLGLSKYKGIVSPAYYVCKVNINGLNSKYLHHLLRSKKYAQEFERLSTGMRIGQWDLGIDDFLKVPLILPPISEQQSIASYLDEKCAAIDEIIAEAKATIDEYKSWKASVIFETVTKGLNPNAEMKDSGVEWIGRIPKHWCVVPLKRFYDNSNGSAVRVGPFGSALSGSDITYEGVWVYNQRAVLDNNFETNNTFVSPEKAKELANFGVFPKDILITTRGSIGKIAIVPDNAPYGILHPCIIRFRIDEKKIDKHLLKYIFNDTDLIKQQILYYSNSTTIDVLYSYTLKELKLPLIPKNEQDEIIAYLDEKCAAIDGVIAEKEALIGELESYKKSLIFETVTGKRRVC